MSNKRGFAALLAVGILLTAVGMAQAGTSTGTVEMKYTHCAPRQIGKIWLNGSYKGAYYTGKYNLQLDPTYAAGDGEPGTGEGETIYAAFEDDGYKMGAFCADAWQLAPTGDTLYDVYRPEDSPIGGANTPMGDVKADQLREFFYNVIQGQAPVPPANPYDLLDPNDNAAAQAFVWEVIHEGTEDPAAYDVFSGDFKMNYYGGSGWLAQANDWLADLATGTWADPDPDDNGLRVLTNLSKQDYALTVPGLGATPVPEPLTMLGVFGAIAGVGAYVRRRRA